MYKFTSAIRSINSKIRRTSHQFNPPFVQQMVQHAKDSCYCQQGLYESVAELSAMNYLRV